MTWIIIMFSIALILIIIVLLMPKKKKGKEKNIDYKGGNPFYTTSHGTCLGINIGDSYDFVLSRIRHLGYSKELERENNLEFENLNDISPLYNRKTISVQWFPHVNIEFDFSGYMRLICIKIIVEPKEYDTEFMFDDLKKHLSIPLKEPKYIFIRNDEIEQQTMQDVETIEVEDNEIRKDSVVSILGDINEDKRTMFTVESVEEYPDGLWAKLKNVNNGSEFELPISALALEYQLIDDKEQNEQAHKKAISKKINFVKQEKIVWIDENVFNAYGTKKEIYDLIEYTEGALVLMKTEDNKINIIIR